ncbi:uncharacterized protein BDZ83DRAFT_635345 [Colletotrichum acutatum]|uniref:Secreted protein n=1 Tax=Glomerella acutata TaxID=27357 RepID=A0AAD8UGV4_GLOAC|nr:uncharacterized protein BDZ83DRAFT_635345 [Colletotrichum acutatum]KAK1716016.1 hypothetical protein BDZ83DRAFT_635345 [Colletotrichum acutatum]
MKPFGSFLCFLLGLQPSPLLLFLSKKHSSELRNSPRMRSRIYIVELQIKGPSRASLRSSKILSREESDILLHIRTGTGLFSL